MVGGSLVTHCWRHRRAPPMRIHERLFLNPFEKLIFFHKFPTAFFFHVVLVALVSWQVLYYVARDVDHIWRTTRHLSSLFLGVREGKLTISRPNHMQSALENVMVTYFDINNVSLVHYDFLKPDELDVQIFFRNRTNRHITLLRDYFKETGYLQTAMPFLYNTDLQTVEMVSITCGFLEKVPEGDFWMTYAWNLNLEFDGKAIGEFWGNLKSQIGTVSGPAYGLVVKDILNSAVLTIAIICIGLISKKIYRSCKIGFELRRRIAAAQAEAVQNGSESISEVSLLSTLSALFSSWWIVSLLSHALQIVSSIFSLQHLDDLTSRFALLGWSCFFTWMAICQYFEFFPAYYTTFSTTQRGLLSICKYMISVMPIFTAFMFLGMSLFWKEQSFRSPSASYASLFSMLNGDSIRATFADIYDGAGWLSSIYLYLFIFIFTYIVLNVNITIIQESFLAAKAENSESGASPAHLPSSASWPSSDDHHLSIASGAVSLQEWGAAAGAFASRAAGSQTKTVAPPGTPERNSRSTQASAAGANLAGENQNTSETWSGSDINRTPSFQALSFQEPSPAESSRVPACRGSQEPLLHAHDALDSEMDFGSQARRRSTSPQAASSFPMMSASRQMSPSSRDLAAQSSSRRMSPRFRNARLQKALAVAFPEERRSASSVASEMTMTSVDTGASSQNSAGEVLPTSFNKPRLMATLASLTHMLRNMAPPTSEEIGGTEGWHELEEMLREHAEAVSSALTRLQQPNSERDEPT